MGCRERGSRARGVYLTQDTPGMGTARVRQEVEANTRIIARIRNIVVKNRGNIRWDLISAKDLTIELFVDRDSP